MIITTAQLIVTRDINENLNKILAILDSAHKNEWVIFPEGMLSGYYPEENVFLEQINSQEIENSINKIQLKVKEKECFCIFGTSYKDLNDWYNASVFLEGSQKIIYYKNNLSLLDKKHFKQGNKLDIYESQGVKFGIQMCRELVFPEQWRLLKQKGAQIIFHINNSIKEEDKVREYLLFARAFENQYFVCSVNNAGKPQSMLSYVISPTGEVLFVSKAQEESVTTIEINLEQVNNTYINQARTDLLSIS